MHEEACCAHLDAKMPRGHPPQDVHDATLHHHVTKPASMASESVGGNGSEHRSFKGEGPCHQRFEA